MNISYIIYEWPLKFQRLTVRVYFKFVFSLQVNLYEIYK